MYWRKILTTALTILCSSSAWADPKFVKDLVSQIRAGLESGTLTRPSEMQAMVRNQCDVLGPPAAEILNRVRPFLATNWVNMDELRSVYESTQGTSKEKLAKVSLKVEIARSKMDRQYFEEGRVLETALKSHLEKAVAARDLLLREFERRKSSAVFDGYGTHCDFRLVESDVQAALIEANYPELDTANLANPRYLDLSYYREIRILENSTDSTVRDLVVDFTWGNDILRCMNVLMAELSQKYNLVSSYRERNRRLLESALDAFEMELKVKKYEHDVDSLEAINKSALSAKTREILGQIPLRKADRDPITMLFARAREILEVSSLWGFDPGARSSADLSEIITKLGALLKEGRELRDSLGFGVTVNTKLPVINEELDDPRYGSGGYRNDSDKFRKALAQGIQDSVFARTGISPTSASTNFAASLKEANWIKRLINYCRDQIRGEEDWQITCDLTDFSVWEKDIQGLIKQAESAVCAVTENEQKDLGQFSGTIRLVPTKSVSQPKSVENKD